MGLVLSPRHLQAKDLPNRAPVALLLAAHLQVHLLRVNLHPGMPVLVRVRTQAQAAGHQQVPRLGEEGWGNSARLTSPMQLAGWPVLPRRWACRADSRSHSDSGYQVNQIQINARRQLGYVWNH